MIKQKFDIYGNRKEYVRNDEFKKLLTLKKKYSKQIMDIKLSNKCFGDKVRDILKAGITNNTIHARKLLEIVE